MKYNFLPLIFMLVAGFLAGCNSQHSGEANNADEDTVEVNQTTEQVIENEDTDTGDLIYLTYMNNQVQTALGNVVQQKASADQVKSFANDLVASNKQLVAKIEQLADAAEMQLPEGLEVSQQQKVDSIMDLPPKEFDKAFLNLVLEQQQENMELLQDLAAKADNEIVRGLAADIADGEKDQIERAKIVQDEMM